MDINPDVSEYPTESLSYDEAVPYVEQLPAESSTDSGHSPLADRIGNTKVYLLSETTGGRLGKRKHGSEEAGEKIDEDIEMNEDSPYRDNAILFHGTPISHLPTSNIFAYATHFDAHPMGLEWIDDTTCILVFSSKASARSAYRRLAKSIAEEPSSEDGTVTAKPIPIAIWPPEERINKSLGKGEGLKGAIRMRWATRHDVKKKGAKKESEFYKKYGRKSGKDGAAGEAADRDEGRQRKRRKESESDEALEKAKLDDDLDAFLAEDDASSRPPSPPSKMRSDYIDRNGKTLLERTSVMRARPDTLASRIMAELPSRARYQRDIGRRDESSSRRLDEHPVERSRRRTRGGERNQGRRTSRPNKTQQDLDDELDAFLNSKE
ncbi:hypothetical protein AcV5_000601 [Taiwanofungus camphoratus]|nr:hypothetical protein AcV5_000601 [Antrodia cinnamomea]